jgi:hypothetical protein
MDQINLSITLFHHKEARRSKYQPGAQNSPNKKNITAPLFPTRFPKNINSINLW